MAQAKSTDLGAALRGLIMASAVIFLLMLTIVWLTNRHFEGKKAAGGHGPPAAAPAATAPAGTTPAATTPAGTAQPGTAPAGAPAATGAHPIPISPEAAAGKPGPAQPPPPPAP